MPPSLLTSHTRLSSCIFLQFGPWNHAIYKCTIYIYIYYICILYGGFLKWVYPKMDGSPIMENPTKMVEGTPILGNLQICILYLYITVIVMCLYCRYSCSNGLVLVPFLQQISLQLTMYVYTIYIYI